MKGVSYRGVKDSLQQFLGLKINHVTAMRWIQNYMARINAFVDNHQPQVSDTWHADEQIVKVKGKNRYMWNCIDHDTRFLLSNHYSPTRITHDARLLFQQAKDMADKPEEDYRIPDRTIITDGAFAYDKAVKREFYTHSNPKPHKRYVSLRQKIGNNNIVERYHSSFRQRDKTMRGFKSVDGVETYAKDYKTYYNFIRPHLGLKSTPAEKAGIHETRNWKELLVKSLNQPIRNTPNLPAED